jgi:hypothetical protein
MKRKIPQLAARIKSGRRCLARRLQLRRNKMTTQEVNMGWSISVGKAGAISAWQVQRVWRNVPSTLAGTWQAPISFTEGSTT